MKKKYLVWFFLSDTINQPLSTHHFLINKLADSFEKLFIVNLKNLDLDLQSKSKNINKFNNDVDNKFIIKNNIEILNPTSKIEFEEFIKDKELNAILINNLSTLISSNSVKESLSAMDT